MKFTRQQRINNVGCTMVQDLTNMAKQHREWLNDGLDIAPLEGYPSLKATGAEVREALGDNAKAIETFVNFVLDGKSNQITKGRKK